MTHTGIATKMYHRLVLAILIHNKLVIAIGPVKHGIIAMYAQKENSMLLKY